MFGSFFVCFVLFWVFVLGFFFTSHKPLWQWESIEKSDIPEVLQMQKKCLQKQWLYTKLGFYALRREYTLYFPFLSKVFFINFIAIYLSNKKRGSNTENISKGHNSKRQILRNIPSDGIEACVLSIWYILNLKVILKKTLYVNIEKQ